MPRQFLRTETRRFSRLGKTRKKLRKWRRPRGPHSKVRKHRFGYPASPAIGYKVQRSERGLVNGKMPVLVHNVQELSRVPKDSIVIIARVGARKKLELIKKADEMKLPIANLGRKK